MYLSLARKWRPQTFDEVVGQDEVVRALKNAISSGKIGHAYLFSGPRGTGKTSLSRILAKSLNCVNGPTVTPCNKCENCVEIKEGRSVDVIEIDGASNRKIDDVRSIREAVKFVPVKSRYKIYIIDEVHMLTDEAFNALLKTLEEPPSHVVFIFATTEPYKVKQTIRSRCQHFVLKPIGTELILQQLSKIIESENFKVNDSVLLKVAKASNGSMRDAESLLDVVVSYIGNKEDFTEEDIDRLLGVIDISHLEKMLDMIVKRDVGGLIKLVNEMKDNGFDLKKLCEELIFSFRNLLVMHQFGVDKSLIRLSETEISVLERFKNAFKREEIIFIENTLIEAYNEMKGSINEIFHIEKAFFKIGNIENVITLSEILEEIKQLRSYYIPNANNTVGKEKPKSDANFVKTTLKSDPVDKVLEEIESDIVDENKLLVDKLKSELSEFFPGIERKVKILVKDNEILIVDNSGIFGNNLLSKEEIINKLTKISGRNVVIEDGGKPSENLIKKKEDFKSGAGEKQKGNVADMVRSLFQAEDVDFSKKT